MLVPDASIESQFFFGDVHPVPMAFASISRSRYASICVLKFKGFIAVGLLNYIEGGYLLPENSYFDPP
jgi:hypothetical protein